MEETFFALLPDAALTGFIKECKRTARSLAGPQKYLEDEPHLTLCVGEYPWGEALESALNGTLAKGPHGLRLAGWRTFSSDPVTGGETLVIKVHPADLEGLRAFQVAFLDAVSGFRTRPIPERYANKGGFTPAMLQCLERYGFPFVGSVWEPHFSIASFRPIDYEKVRPNLTALTPPDSTGRLELAYCLIRETGYSVIRRWAIGP